MLDAERNAIFAEWIEAHKAILFKVARAYGATHTDREDLFQEIALQLWHSVDAFRGDAAVGTWIYRVALNTAIAWGRKEGRHGQGPSGVARFAYSSNGPETFGLSELVLAILRRHVPHDALPPCGDWSCRVSAARPGDMPSPR